MALRLIQAPWTQQPQGAGVALAPRFAAARRGFVFNAGPGSLGDGSIGLSTINSAYTGPRFGPTPDGVGMRLYADHGGNDDDRPQSSFVLPTAKSANLTTVLVFAAINNTYVQGWGPTGHLLRITDPSAYKVQCGYYGDNGFNYIFEDARSDVFDGRAHTLVVSTHITAKQISVSWDGNPCTYLSGSLSYIGDGTIPATNQPYLGDRVWTNYYNPNGHLLLWAYLPDVFLAQGEAHELARNPWSLFEPRRIWVPVAAGGTAHDGTGALSSDAATISGTAAHFTLHASSGALSSDASTIAGSANHIVVHPSSGALSSQDATLAGTALRYRQFSATGALDSASATIAGDAAHTTTGTFSATGALSAQDGTIAGTATHLTLHTATGAIQASDSTITGTAARLGTHDATGSLSADLASITGTVLHTGDGAEVVPLRTGGHAFMRERFAQARKRLALQRILSYLTEEEPAEETKRIIRAVKAGKPIQDKKPPVVMAEVSAEKIAEKLIPSRVADLAEIPDIDMQAVIKKAIRLAQERDDEDVLLLL